MTDKEIIIDGVTVSKCKHYKINGKCRIPHYQQGIKYISCNCNEWDCYYKQLQKEKFENLNNRQMIESAENLIYENSELYKNLKEKEQECEKLQKEYQQLQKRFNIVYDDLMYMNVYQCKKCGHYTMKDYICHICGTDPTEAKDGNNE